MEQQRETTPELKGYGRNPCDEGPAPVRTKSGPLPDPSTASKENQRWCPTRCGWCPIPHQHSLSGKQYMQLSFWPVWIFTSCITKQQSFISGPRLSFMLLPASPHPSTLRSCPLRTFTGDRELRTIIPVF